MQQTCVTSCSARTILHETLGVAARSSGGDLAHSCGICTASLWQTCSAPAHSFGTCAALCGKSCSPPDFSTRLLNLPARLSQTHKYDKCSAMKLLDFWFVSRISTHAADLLFKYVIVYETLYAADCLLKVLWIFPVAFVRNILLLSLVLLREDKDSPVDVITGATLANTLGSPTAVHCETLVRLAYTTTTSNHLCFQRQQVRIEVGQDIWFNYYDRH